MKTFIEIIKAAKVYSEQVPLQDAVREGARYAVNGKYYKHSALIAESKTDLTEAEAIFEEYNDTFQEWWNMYSKKRGKKKAKQKVDRLTVAQQVACLKATPNYVASTPDPVYRKDPLTYLNGECWNDEIIQKQNNEQQRAINLTAKAARILGSDY